jgi:hypothetical protein
MAGKISLSVALAVYNEEANLASCLASVKDIADEIVVVDGGSTDRTVSIAESFGTNVIRTSNPAIFHINKQKALDACRGEWMLQLDADEVIPEDLKKEVSFIVGHSPKFNGYYIPRKNYFLTHWLRKGGQYPDYVIRLVRKGKAHFPQKTVHEQIAVEGEVGYLKHPMLHNSYPTRADYWRKAAAYTSLTAQTLNNPSAFAYLVTKPIGTFLSLYIRHKGFMDGLSGFEFALYSALHYPMAYLKYRQ